MVKHGLIKVLFDVVSPTVMALVVGVPASANKSRVRL
jgi:hypothetical protein